MTMITVILNGNKKIIKESITKIIKVLLTCVVIKTTIMETIIDFLIILNRN